MIWNAGQTNQIEPAEGNSGASPFCIPALTGSFIGDKKMNRETLRREKISKSLQGKYGKKSRRWKGDKAGYVAIHLWVKKHFGRKKCCEQCGRKPPEVSRLELANISGKYLRIKSDWQTLCTSCHLKRDFRARIKACPQGHIYTKKNTYINCRGHRECRICKNESQRRFKEKKLCVA